MNTNSEINLSHPVFVACIRIGSSFFIRLLVVSDSGRLLNALAGDSLTVQHISHEIPVVNNFKILIRSERAETGSGSYLS